MNTNTTDVLTESVTFTIKHQLPVTSLIELVNAAFETGAIAYWVDLASDIKRAPEGLFDYTYCYRFLIEADGDTLELNVDTIRKGIQLILDGTVGVNQRLRGYIVSALADDDLGMIDSDALDVIVQAGLFQELVYG